MTRKTADKVPDFKPKLNLEPVPQDSRIATWYSGGNAGAMKEIVNSETFRKAEALLHANSRPTRGTLRSAEENSLSHAWSAGYADAFADLRKLSHAPKNSHAQNFSTSAEWDHVS
jgi:hypothetical protein